MKEPEQEDRDREGEEGEAPGEHPWGDRGQIVALVVFLAVWALDSFVLRFSTFLAQDAGLLVRLGASGLVMALAVYFMQGGHRAAGHHSRVSQGLITGGAFARVRHPLYTGSLMFYLSLVVATLSLVSLAVWGGMFAFYDVIASYEERRLAEAFGPAYQAYRAKVPKWLPRFRAAR
jgi:protein-S-isoprenylcysteine O-methyltransferase Ste14